MMEAARRWSTAPTDRFAAATQWGPPTIRIPLEIRSTEQHMSNDEHDHEKPRLVTIIINTRSYEVPKNDLLFEELAQLAYPDSPGGENISFTIGFRNGHGNKPEGSLVAGQSVKVKEGMIFNVVRTDKS